MLESVVGNSRIIYDAAIVDPIGIAILDTNPVMNGKAVPERPTLSVLRDAGFRHQLRMLYGPRTVYDVSVGLEMDGQTFGSIQVGVSTVFLRNELTPRLQQAGFFSVVAIFCSLVLASVVSNVALGPLRDDQPRTSTAPVRAIPCRLPKRNRVRRSRPGVAEDCAPGSADPRHATRFFPLLKTTSSRSWRNCRTG